MSETMKNGSTSPANPLDAPTVPKRQKTGGRKAGTPNKRTAERQAALAAIKASGRDPLTFFGDLLRNEDAPLELRFQAAKELAPYMHPRLASIEARGGGKTHEERIIAMRHLLEDDESAHSAPTLPTLLNP